MESLNGKHVKIIVDPIKIKETQKSHHLNTIDYDKYKDKIGHVYYVKEDVVKVQYYINDIQHILVHKSLLIDVTNRSCTSSQIETEKLSILVKSDGLIKIGKLSKKSRRPNSSVENYFRQSSNINRLCELKLEEIFSAIKDENIRDIKHLCVNNVHINDKDSKKQTALHCASYYGKLHHIKTLLECGCELNSIDDDGDTAVHMAIYKEHYDSVVFLIKENPSFLETKNLKRETPFLLAAKKKNDEIFLLLLESNDKVINEPDTDGNVALHFVVKNNKVELFKKLLSYKNLKLDIMNKDKISPYYHACYYGHKEIIECFIKYCKGESNFVVINNLMLYESSHQILIRHKHYDVAKWLIMDQPIKWSNHKVSPRYGSILHIAVSHLQFEIVRIIILFDPSITKFKNNKGKTALDIALEMYSGMSENDCIEGRNIAQLLIDKGSLEILPSNREILNNLLRERENENTKLQETYNHLKEIYEECKNLENHIQNFGENCTKSVAKCFCIIKKYVTNDLIKKIINENINKYEKIILDCVMIGTSILCEISDDNDVIALKIADDDVIMSILDEFVDKLSNKIKPFSISDQLIENIVFICLNVARRSNETKINEIIVKLRYCLNNEDINLVIKVGVALTIAFIGDVNDHEISKIEKLIKETIDKIKERKEDNWCGLSLNELNEGLEKIS